MVPDDAVSFDGDDAFFLPGPGAVLNGRYRLERLFASQGGDALWHATYLSADDGPAGGHPVLVKFYQRGQQFERWMNWLGRFVLLDGDVLPRVHCIGQTATAGYLVTDPVRGCRLDRWLADYPDGRTLSELEPLLRALARAIDRVHAKGIVVRSVQPCSVSFDAADASLNLFNLDLPDFRGDTAPKLKRYASPEAMRGDPADVRDDVFSFACIAYELLSGRPPFGGIDTAQAAALGRVAPPLERLTAGQNRALARGLALSRDARAVSAEKILRELLSAEPSAMTSAPRSLTAQAFAAVMVMAGGALYWSVEHGALRADRPLIGAALLTFQSPNPARSSLAASSMETPGRPDPSDFRNENELAAVASTDADNDRARTAMPDGGNGHVSAAPPDAGNGQAERSTRGSGASQNSTSPAAGLNTSGSRRSAVARSELSSRSGRAVGSSPAGRESTHGGSVAIAYGRATTVDARARGPDSDGGLSTLPCPRCNCADLSYQRSFTAEPLRPEEQKFLRENCAARQLPGFAKRRMPQAATRPGRSRFAAAGRQCPACDCAELAVKRSFTLEPFRAEEEAFFESHCTP